MKRDFVALKSKETGKNRFLGLLSLLSYLGLLPRLSTFLKYNKANR